MRVLVLALATLSLQAGELKLTDEMWNDIRPVYAKTLAHPFLKGLTDGTLEVGKELIKKGSKDPEYQKWIDSYASDAYAKEVADVLEMMNAEAAKLDPESRQAVRELFKTSARYEWMFWDMAWREEKWLP